MGEPQLPSWTNSHEYVGLAISSLVCQKWRQVGIHQEDVLVVLPRQHRVEAVDLAREEGKTLILHHGAVQGAHLEMEEVVGLEDLGENHLAVERGVSGIVADRAVLVMERHEAGVFDAVGLGG